MSPIPKLPFWEGKMCIRDRYEDNINQNFIKNRNEAMKLLQQENELDEIVKLVGIDALSPADRLVRCV